MVKFGALKKIAALTAAIAMVLSFAICAGAVNIETTTQYVEGTENAKVNVIANVSGLGEALYVTYYATNDDGDVYIDQENVVDGAATFDYVTAATNLNSNVKVGYAAGTAAEETVIDGYEVTVTDGTATPAVIPTNSDSTVVLAYNVGATNEVTGVSATGATAELVTYDATSVTVNLTNVKGDVAITVTTQALANVDAEGEFVSAGAVVSNGANDVIYDAEGNPMGAEGEAYRADEGDRKLTVLAKVLNSTEYGVIITKEPINNVGAVDSIDGIDGVYAAKGTNATGHFAVQLIDNGADEDGALIQSGVGYNTYVYYKTVDGYMIVAGTVANTTPAVTD